MNTYNVNDFPSVFLTADIVVLNRGRVLLIQRRSQPFKDCWALPGGFFDVPDDAEVIDAAIRELFEETNLTTTKDALKFIGLFSKKNRDPREAMATKPCRIVSAAYLLTADHIANLKAKDDALSLEWFDINALPELAFDHLAILNEARKLIDVGQTPTKL